MKPAIKLVGSVMLIFAVPFFLLLARLPSHADSLLDVSEPPLSSALSMNPGLGPQESVRFLRPGER